VWGAAYYQSTVFTTNEGTPRHKVEWLLCLISKSRTVTGGVASNS
jgi:hypothetical protein